VIERVVDLLEEIDRGLIVRGPVLVQILQRVCRNDLGFALAFADELFDPLRGRSSARLRSTADNGGEP